MIANHHELPVVPSAPAAEASAAPHPLGSQAKVLLSSVFGPYAQDDEYGGRAMNPMELYHNQVTRVQGPFSLRMFHRSWGLMLIQANIAAPCVLLDFPTMDRFIQEIRDNDYDVVGISSIIPNVGKVRKMCALVRRYLPRAKIVIGGHVANLPDIHEQVDADFVVKGEGVRWFRRYLGEETKQPVRHPAIISGHGTRNSGITCPEKPGDVAATVIPSVGCPLGCDFCSTSAMFGGKGKFVDFYSSGDELFEIMEQLAARMQVRSFFMMDENFLLHRKRALRLMELMERENKPWSLYVFSSANVLTSYSVDELVRLGVSWVWMGLEGENSQYRKLHGIDVPALVRKLQSHGIRVLGSSIIALDEHTPENIDRVIDYAAAYDTDFHQFMLYTPIPGTPLYARLSAEGRMKDPAEFEHGDIHGQEYLNYRHPHIPPKAEAEMMVRAFTRDFEVNGPSVMRIVRTTLAGWKRYKNHPDARIRDRFAWEARDLPVQFSALLGAARRYYRKNPAMHEKIARILADLHAEFGLKSRLASGVGGLYVLRKIRQEERRLAQGWTYEPPTFYERNAACDDHPEAALCHSVTTHRPAAVAEHPDATSAAGQPISVG